ncbi:MAG: PAS domain S-box-containing protein [Glaciecola sp.]|jgi:PAS domain S-box-containing protein
MTLEKNKVKIKLSRFNHTPHDIEEHFYTVFNNTHDPAFAKDQEFKFVLVNDTCCRSFGLSRNQIIGTTLAENIPASEMEQFLSLDKKVLETGIEIMSEGSISANGVQRKVTVTRKKRFVDSKGNYLLAGTSL